MLNEKQKELVKHANELSPDPRVLSNYLIEKVEEELNIHFSDEFKLISEKYSYEWIGGFEWLAFGMDDDTSVSSMTQVLRENYNLPHNYVCLADDGTSMILMETQDDRTKLAPVIWCSIEDVFRLGEGKEMIYERDIFNNFTDFFAFLIKKEKEDQGIE